MPATAATTTGKATAFLGWRVAAAAFVLAFFGWGIGFYGPPVFLEAVRQSRGWPVPLISAAVTTHFLVGALAVANLPALYRAWGVAPVTRLAALAIALGIVGWSLAAEPWQLFAATLLTGSGWAAMSAAAVNAIVSPWFVRGRVAALGMAYNGASIGGLVFSPLWVTAIGGLGFTAASLAVGAVTVAAVWLLAGPYFSRTPEMLGQEPDGNAPGTPTVPVTAAWALPLPGRRINASRQFITLAAAMALGLFAQIGLVAHLYSLLVPALGAATAGLVMGVATGLGMAGRMAVGWLMPVDADRRVVASASYGVQIAGSVALFWAGGSEVWLLLLGSFLFGVGIGNATSMPPLIAQVEFVKEDVGRAVAQIVALSQAVYAFAPAAFGILRALPAGGDPAAGAAPYLFLAAALAQGLAILAMLAGRRHH